MTVQTKTQNPKDLGNVLSFFEDDNIEPFDVDYQNRFLNVFITDKEGFPERIIDIVQVDYFDAYQKILLDYELNFFSQYREVARFATLRDIINEKEKGLNKDHLIGLLEKIEQIKLENIDHVKDSSYRFFKERSVKNCLFELVVDWKKHNYDSMKTKLENALKAGEPKEAGHNYLKDVLKRLDKDFRDPISFIPSLDLYIGGGASAGEMAFVLAPTGGGKSMFLVAGASTALLAGKKVVYYTLELSEEVVGQRFDSCINQIGLKNVWDFSDIIQERTEEIAKFGGSLIIKEFLTGHATINTLMAHLRTLETTDGFKPDIVFIDYGDLLKPLDSFSEKRHSLDSIYIGIRGMANEFRIPIWSALQTNRTGMDTDKVSLSTVGETLGALRAADIVISVGREPDRDSEEVLENPNAAKIGILKNRNGAAGFYLDAIFDTSKIFIDIKPLDPSMIGMKKKTKQTNKKIEKKEGSVDDVENGLDNILLS
jgi:hypothetical protein